MERLDGNSASNARLGLRLFFVYSAFYFAYVLVMAFVPEWSQWKFGAGLNLAVVWGFALIGAAFLLALIYGFACREDSPLSAGTDARSAAHSEEDAG